MGKVVLGLVTSCLCYFFGWMGWGFFPAFIVAIFFVGVLKKEENRWKIRMLYDADRFSRQEKLESDFEFAEWLNIPIQRIWNVYEKTLSIKITEAVQPIFDSVRPKSIKDIRFSKFSLGPKAPYIEQAKAYSRTGMKQIKMDVWLAFDAPEAEIVLSVKFGLGLSAPIALKDVSIHAKLRAEAILQDSFPFVNTLKISLLEAPQIHFTLKPLKGPDLMDMPGLSGFLDSLINDNIEAHLVNPRYIEVPFDRMMNGKPTKDQLFRRAVGVVRLTIKSAQNLVLKKTSIGSTCDPYCIITVEGSLQEFRTRVIKKNSNPEWNQTFRLLVHKPDVQRVKICIFDKNTIKADEYIGSVLVPLDDLPFREGEVIEKSFDIEDNKADKDLLTVSCCYGKIANPKVEAEEEDFPAEKADEKSSSEKESSYDELEDEGDDDAADDDENQNDLDEWEEDPANKNLQRNASNQSEMDRKEAHNKRLRNYLPPNIISGICRVTIHKGKDLLGVDSSGTSDPYVTVKMDGDDVKIFKTEVCKATCFPVWNETFEVIVMDRMATTLHFIVKDYNPALVNEYLGEKIINVGEFVKNRRITKRRWLKLDNCLQGELQFSFEFRLANPCVFLRTHENDSEEIAARRKEKLKKLGKYGKRGKIYIGNPHDKEAGLLYVTLHEARKLVAADPHLFGKGTSDPFVTVKVGDKFVHKTRYIKKTLDPSWEECCTIRIRLDPLIALRFDVYDFDLVGSDDHLGFATFSLASLIDEGRENFFKGWLKLSDAKHGEILVSLKYRPRDQSIPVDASEIAEAEDLAALELELDEEPRKKAASKATFSDSSTSSKEAASTALPPNPPLDANPKSDLISQNSFSFSPETHSPALRRLSVMSPSLGGSLCEGRCLEVVLMELNNFPLRYSSGDYLKPFVRVVIDRKYAAKSTPWKKNTLPEWNETLCFRKVNPSSELSLRIEEKGVLNVSHTFCEGKVLLTDYLHPESNDSVDIHVALSPARKYSHLFTSHHPAIRVQMRFLSSHDKKF